MLYRRWAVREHGEEDEDEDVARYQDLYYALRRLCLLHMYTQHRRHIYTHQRQSRHDDETRLIPLHSSPLQSLDHSPIDLVLLRTYRHRVEIGIDRLLRELLFAQLPEPGR